MVKRLMKAEFAVEKERRVSRDSTRKVKKWAPQNLLVITQKLLETRWACATHLMRTRGSHREARAKRLFVCYSLKSLTPKGLPFLPSQEVSAGETDWWTWVTPN